MMKRRNFLQWSALASTLGLIPGAASAASAAATASAAAGSTTEDPALTGFAVTSPGGPATGLEDRALWVSILSKMATPVLSNMSQGLLQKNMHLELSPRWDNRDKKVAYMECIGRLMSGLAPWLSLAPDSTPEGKLRASLTKQALASLAHAVDPQSPDCLLWDKEGQPLVDAAYIAQTFLVAPATFWEPLGATTKQRYIDNFKQLRRITPPNNNWVLFAAMKEAFLCQIGQDYSQDVIDGAIQKIDGWYVGDGWYSDGPKFHFDYYNSYVIQPMLLHVLKVMVAHGKRPQSEYDLALKRMQRYSEFLERFVSPEGTFPVFGRSATYRVAIFQPLGHLALADQLTLPPAQVRSAMTAVMKRMFAQPGIFTNDGWLTLGFAGHQPDMADYYSNAGSMYLASLGFLALGLPETHPFWAGPHTAWTQCLAWGGQPFNIDHAIDN